MTRNKMFKKNYLYVDEIIIGKIIGKKLKEVRNKKEISIGRLSLLSGVNKNTISRTERGMMGITTQNLIKIVIGLDITMSELWGDVDHFCRYGILMDGKTEEIFNEEELND